MNEMSPPPGQVPCLVSCAAAGDREAIVKLLERYRSRLRRMVALRVDPRLNGRVDASDVIQEALNRMDALDREILVPRHYEQISNGHAAANGSPGPNDRSADLLAHGSGALCQTTRHDDAPTDRQC